jgi:hypothetical protein
MPVSSNHDFPNTHQDHMITQRPLVLSALLLTSGLLAAHPARAAETEGGTTSIIEMILHGGPLIIMIWLAIVATSVVMVTFIIQLFLQAWVILAVQ